LSGIVDELTLQQFNNSTLQQFNSLDWRPVTVDWRHSHIYHSTLSSKKTYLQNI